MKSSDAGLREENKCLSVVADVFLCSDIRKRCRDTTILKQTFSYTKCFSLSLRMLEEESHGTAKDKPLRPVYCIFMQNSG